MVENDYILLLYDIISSLHRPSRIAAARYLHYPPCPHSPPRFTARLSIHLHRPKHIRPPPHRHGPIPHCHRRIPHHRPVRVLLRHPRALEPPRRDADLDAGIQAGGGDQHDIQLALGEEGHGPGALAAVQEDLEDAAVDDALQHPGALGIDNVVCRDLVGEERVVEPPDAAAVDEEGRVAAEEKPAAHRLARDGGEESEVSGAGDVGGGDGGDVDGEVDGAGVERRVVNQDGAVAEGVVLGDLRVVQGREVVRHADQVVADARDVGEHVAARQRHAAAPVLERAGGDDLRVLPVGGPGDGDLRLVGGNAVEELAGVVVLAEVGDAGDAVDGGEVAAVEVAGEVLRDAAAERRARVDANDEEEHVLLSGVEHGHGDQVGAFVLQAEQAVVREVGGVRPVFQVRGGVDADHEVLRVRHDHDPG